MRLRIALLGSIAIAAATPASADTAPGWSDLPVGRLTSRSSGATPPWTIASSESVRGFAVSPPLRVATVGKKPASPQALTVAARATTYDDIQRGSAKTPEDANVCFSPIDSRVGIVNLPGADALEEWNTTLAWTTHSYSAARVVIVHSEKLVESAAGASLESTDAWIDTTTTGVRQAAKSTLPLKLLRSLPGGIKVYAGRDERADGKKLVQFVVAHPIEELASSTIVTGADGVALGAGNCGFARAAIKVADGGGVASVQITAALPPVGPGEKAPPNPFGPLEPNAKAKDIRVRAMRIHLSVSQSSADKEPLVSVAPGWVTRESMQRVFPGKNRLAGSFGF